MQAQRLTPLPPPHPPPDPPRVARDTGGTDEFARLFDADAEAVRTGHADPSGGALRTSERRSAECSEPPDAEALPPDPVQPDPIAPQVPSPGQIPEVSGRLLEEAAAVPSGTAGRSGEAPSDGVAGSVPTRLAEMGETAIFQARATPGKGLEDTVSARPADPAALPGRGVQATVAPESPVPPEAAGSSKPVPSPLDRDEIRPDRAGSASGVLPAPAVAGQSSGLRTIPAQPELSAALTWKMRSLPDTAAVAVLAPAAIPVVMPSAPSGGTMGTLPHVTILLPPDPASDPRNTTDDGSGTLSMPQPPVPPVAPGAIPSTPNPILGLPQNLGRDLSAILSSRPDGPVEISLAPIELGRLRLRFWHEGDQLRVVVQAEHRETLDLLRRNGDQLMQEIRTAGFAGADLSFAGWGNSKGEDARPAPPVEAPESGASTASEPRVRVESRLPATGLDLRF